MIFFAVFPPPFPSRFISVQLAPQAFVEAGLADRILLGLELGALPPVASDVIKSSSEDSPVDEIEAKNIQDDLFITFMFAVSDIVDVDEEGIVGKYLCAHGALESVVTLLRRVNPRPTTNGSRLFSFLPFFLSFCSSFIILLR